MTQKLTNLHADFIKIKDYLTRIGPLRSDKQIAETKLAEAKQLYGQLDSILTQVNQEVGEKEIGYRTVKSIQYLVDDIGVIYLQIKTLTSKVDSHTQTPPGKEEEDDNFQDSSETEIKMASPFDIKTAISQLPVLDGTEQVTNQLIDGIIT